VRCVSYQRKVGDEFFPELVVIIISLNIFVRRGVMQTKYRIQLRQETVSNTIAYCYNNVYNIELYLTEIQAVVR
jgi:hypothetical protein